MKITVLSVGKPKNKLFRDGTIYYLEQVKRYLNVELIAVADSSQKGNTEKTRNIEGESILRVIRERDYVVLLDDKGCNRTSSEFAEWLEERLKEARGRLVFIIGGPFGVSDQVKKRSDSMLSLSSMTFPHELCLVFLSEQIYRACTIKAGTGYHH